MKYAIVASIVLAAYSFSQCYSYLTEGQSVGFFKSAYCRISFLHFLPRRFSPVDFVVHLFLWIILGIVVWRAYGKYLKGRFY
ncbi:MAG: hypothetical protein A2785_00685 [Candidatus Chisholmbacteria bacterium RIFCSPHIGHO2_01_FULL_49_18]|uniref:Uncharacterized protein n=2 Tax=Candidatus Chisholmiibacteriota TaxID=1817900 RepID=A0A1G1VP04_9BACT|nr:MAG: hypothetical protein A2785_00685 [Candidatus Chisholmbacteria bacterium RIFCSPHIGHO2_01_FULL_49_18]OGY21160.1 MAG: hypothetical protein A3A65_03690 [Candidatus Chisholmbacteria bacterium RIFCSPLOWO2_01_FULL_49_14]